MSLADKREALSYVSISWAVGMSALHWPIALLLPIEINRSTRPRKIIHSRAWNAADWANVALHSFTRPTIECIDCGHLCSGDRQRHFFLLVIRFAGLYLYLCRYKCNYKTAIIISNIIQWCVINTNLLTHQLTIRSQKLLYTPSSAVAWESGSWPCCWC